MQIFLFYGNLMWKIYIHFGSSQFFPTFKPYHWYILLWLLFAFRNRRFFLKTERLKGRFKEEILKFFHTSKRISFKLRETIEYLFEKIKQNVVVKYHWIKYNHTYPLSNFIFSLTIWFFITFIFIHQNKK